MDVIKKVFPYSFGAKKGIDLLYKVIVYIIVGGVSCALIGLLSQVPVVNLLIGTICGIIGLYTFVGIVFAALDFLKVLK